MLLTYALYQRYGEISVLVEEARKLCCTSFNLSTERCALSLHSKSVAIVRLRFGERAWHRRNSAFLLKMCA